LCSSRGSFEFSRPRLEPVEDRRRQEEGGAEGRGGRAGRPGLGRRRGRVGVGVAAHGGRGVVLARAAVLAQTQVLTSEVRDAREGLVLLEVPLLAAVAVAAPGPARTVLGGVAVLHLVHAEPLVDLPPVLMALARLAALGAAVALLAAQVPLLRGGYAAVVLPRVANVQEARVFAALSELLAVGVVYAAGEDAARGERVAAPARGGRRHGHGGGGHHGQARQQIRRG